MQPAATLSVSPDQTQHFITGAGSLSLSCAGDSAAWTVNRFSSAGYLTRCASWGSMIGPTCNVIGIKFREGVYWCESATGQFSNAVNITGSGECRYYTTPHLLERILQGAQPIRHICLLQPSLGTISALVRASGVQLRRDLIRLAVALTNGNFSLVRRNLPHARHQQPA